MSASLPSKIDDLVPFNTGELVTIRSWEDRRLALVIKRWPGTGTDYWYYVFVEGEIILTNRLNIDSLF
jgi:hypothetical protein